MDQRGNADLCKSFHPSHGVLSWTYMLTRDQLEGKDDDKTDIMLNPARALVGAYGDNKAMADAFADWIGRPEGGQRVVSEFKQNGVVLYTRAP